MDEDKNVNPKQNDLKLNHKLEIKPTKESLDYLKEDESNEKNVLNTDGSSKEDFDEEDLSKYGNIKKPKTVDKADANNLTIRDDAKEPSEKSQSNFPIISTKVWAVMPFGIFVLIWSCINLYFDYSIKAINHFDKGFLGAFTTLVVSLEIIAIITSLIILFSRDKYRVHKALTFFVFLFIFRILLAFIFLSITGALIFFAILNWTFLIIFFLDHCKTKAELLT